MSVPPPVHSAARAIRLPRPGFVGSWIFRLAPLRRGTILENLRRAFGRSLAEREIVRLAQANYSHLARCLREWIRYAFLSKARRAAWIRVENAEAVASPHLEGRGSLVLTGHLGNWETAPLLAMEHLTLLHEKMHVFRRPLRVRFVERLLRRRYRSAGLGLMAKQGSIHEVFQLVRRGEVVVFVMDQHASRADGVPSAFFGHPVRTFKALALAALRTGVQVVPASMWREPDGTHRLRFGEPISLESGSTRDEVVEATTRSYDRALEAMIREHPEQWIWMHRRWKKPRGARQGDAAAEIVGAGSGVEKRA